MSSRLVDDAISMLDKAGMERPYLQSKYGVTESQIREAEDLLGVSFPESYRYFLAKFGSGDFKGIEFYGLVPNDNELEEIPNTVWFTKNAISFGDIKEGFVVVEDLGDGTLACLDTNLMNERECPVVICDLAESTESGRNPVLAESFGKYFFDRLESAVKG